jgi:predicted phage terminase large subunit-like protein
LGELGFREALYGGAAAGGKSEALLVAALQYVDVPGYAALLLRRTYQDLALPEALMDRAAQWLQGTDASWSAADHTWTFPSGATLTFGYLDTERSQYRYQSAAFQFCGLDELTQFTEGQYRFLFSRLRRKAGVNVPLRMRSATNPGGAGHEWVKTRFVDPGDPSRPFIRALLEDNPHIDQEAYRKSLSLLMPLQRAWYESGDWNAMPGGNLVQRDWFPTVEAAPVNARRVRYWDFAATEASLKGDDPDWTVGTKEAKTADGMIYIEHVVRVRAGPGHVEALLRQTAESDGRGVTVVWEQEPGASGKLFAASMVRALAGWPVQSVPSTTNKIIRAMPLWDQAKAGNVRLVRGGWNQAWLDEVCSVPNAGHDDQWDSAGGAFMALTSGGWARGAV